jgi:hypothetical protein
LTKYSAKQYFLNSGLCHLCKVRRLGESCFHYLF